jgi:hypothetical protein
MTTRKPWTDTENAALAALYFAMLDAAITGEKYNKAAMIRAYQFAGKDQPFMAASALAARSRGSIEAKLMNASAAHRDLFPDAVTMDGFGYRALANYQKALRDAIHDALLRRDVYPKTA